jgi:hypothetical protein
LSGALYEVEFMRVRYGWGQAAFKLTFAGLFLLRGVAGLAADQLVEVDYDQPGVTHITITGSGVTRTDWTRDPKPKSRSWALTDDERAALTQSLLDSGFLQGGVADAERLGWLRSLRAQDARRLRHRFPDPCRCNTRPRAGCFVSSARRLLTVAATW